MMADPNSIYNGVVAQLGIDPADAKYQQDVNISIIEAENRGRTLTKRQKHRLAKDAQRIADAVLGDGSTSS